jgi:hypothetical protein
VHGNFVSVSHYALVTPWVDEMECTHYSPSNRRHDTVNLRATAKQYAPAPLLRPAGAAAAAAAAAYLRRAESGCGRGFRWDWEAGCEDYKGCGRYPLC